MYMNTYILFLSTSVTILPVWVKSRNFISFCILLPSPIYNIIVLNISFTYIYTHIRSPWLLVWWIIFCWNLCYETWDLIPNQLLGYADAAGLQTILWGTSFSASLLSEFSNQKKLNNWFSVQKKYWHLISAHRWLSF